MAESAKHKSFDVLTQLLLDSSSKNIKFKQKPSKINLLKHKMNITTIRTPENYHFNNERTIAGTATKNEKRTAHIPRKEVIKRPTIVADYRSKISATIHQRYLNLIVDEYMKFTPAEKVPEIALQGEIEVYKSCSSKLGYLNKAIHFIKKLRGLTNENNKESANSTEKQPAPIMKLPSALPEEKKLENNVTEIELYERLKPYILTEKELENNQFPRPDGSGRAKFYLSDLYKEPYLPSDERFCVRCQKCYRVNSQGKSIVEENCSYHWAKSYPRIIGDNYTNIHRCCLGERGSSGCAVDTNHVHHKNKFDGSSGYVSTPKRPTSVYDIECKMVFTTAGMELAPIGRTPSAGPGVYAMDCEMVYTTAGMELAQITIVDFLGRVAFTTHVKPDHEVIDYNTRFSGVQEKDLKDCPVSLIQVQEALRLMLSSDTILIGHSLESDLMAVKLVHSTVIDTSVLYSHRVGRPLKRGLKSLAHDYLNIAIQEKPNGHDSKADAITALRLVHYQLNEDSNNSQKDHN